MFPWKYIYIYMCVCVCVCVCVKIKIYIDFFTYRIYTTYYNIITLF